MKYLRGDFRRDYLELRGRYASREISPAQYAIDLDAAVRRYLAIWLPGDSPYPRQVWAGRNGAAAGRRIRIDRFADDFAHYTVLAGDCLARGVRTGRISLKGLRAHYEPEEAGMAREAL